MNRLNDVAHTDGSYYGDLIERILDRGVVIDSTFDFDVAGVRLLRVDMWLVIASLETFEELASTEAGETLGISPALWTRPRPGLPFEMS